MTEDERTIMLDHVAYWTELMEQGRVVAFGPVDEPTGSYGIGIVTVSPDEIDGIRDNDPAIRSGDSAGALYVVDGELVEQRPNPAGLGRPLRRVLRALDDRPMAPSHIHAVANESDTVATSVHVYSPPLAAMHHFDFTPDSELRMIRREVIDTPGPAFA